jgi:ribosomal protein L11 methyltransferase
MKLGASKALGVDIDPEALDSARENARLNEVKDGLEIRLGSTAEILAGDFTFQQAPVVLANILAPVIVRLLEDHLAKVVTPGGVLVLSGILEDQLEGKDGHVSVLEALQKHNLHVLEIQRIQDWVALVVRVNKS